MVRDYYRKKPAVTSSIRAGRELPIPWGKADLKLGDRRGEILLSSAEFEAHCLEAQVLVRKIHGPGVLVHEDSAGTRLVTKVWYPRGRWSSDRIWPYSERFRRALGRLRALDVRVPQERAHGRVQGSAVRFVIYEWFEGTPVRSQLADVGLKAIAAYVAQLHAKGVYFRGLHLGSMLALKGGDFGLIDVCDTKFLDQPLPLRMRERNLGILCAHAADLAFMRDGNWSDLVMDYCRAANLNVTQAARMRDRVQVQMQRRIARHKRRRAPAALETLAAVNLLEPSGGPRR